MVGGGRFVRERGWKKVKQETSPEVDGCVVYEDGEGGRLRYWPAFLPAEEATQLYDHLRTTTSWSQGHGRTTASSPTSATASATTAESPGPSYVNAQGARVRTPRLQKVRVVPRKQRCPGGRCSPHTHTHHTRRRHSTTAGA